MANIKKIHPGIYIKESLEVIEMTAKEFSIRTGISERTLSPIINGKGDITFDVAFKLALFFDNSIDFWTNLQNQYNLYILEENKTKEFEQEWQLAKKVKKYLLEINAIALDDSKKDVVLKCRKLIGVNNLSLLNKKDSFACLKEEHTKKNVDYFIQNFWIALALNEARKKNDRPFNKKVLNSSLKEIRNLTTKEPSIFMPRLKEILKNSGISFVLLPYLPKSNIYGVTKWFSKDNVMLAISNRGGKADLFWFTLFHEISHVLMEHHREALVNIEGKEDEEADNMATNMLTPEKDWFEFISKNNFSKATINEFANRIGVLPMIVLGRLHKEKGRKLKYGLIDKELNVHYDTNLLINID